MVKPVQSLWIGTQLSVMERLCIHSFLANGYPFHLYTYQDIANTPPGVVIKDAESIMPHNRIFKYKDFDSYAGFANLFRYKLLLEKGGWWVDMDMILLKDIVNEQPYAFASQIQRQRDKKVFVVANNCVMCAPNGSDIMEYCFDQSNKRNAEDLYWGETGPNLLTRAIVKYELSKCVMAPNAFCPISWWEWRNVTDESINNNLNKSFCVHLWNEMWRRNGYDKSANYHHGSLYEKLKNKYNVL